MLLHTVVKEVLGEEMAFDQMGARYADFFPQSSSQAAGHHDPQYGVAWIVELDVQQCRASERFDGVWIFVGAAAAGRVS